MIGDVVKKYESGDLGAAAISNDSNDPGGASYGAYQLSANTGTLSYFLKEMGYSKYFVGLIPGTRPFNEEWLAMCHRQEFVDAQWQYICNTHYQPVRDYATALNVLDTPAINEALWSMAVQHGHAKQIVLSATADYTVNLKDETDTINTLYDARCDYVDSLGMGYLKKRYDLEVDDVLAMVQK